MHHTQRVTYCVTPIYQSIACFKMENLITARRKYISEFLESDTSMPKVIANLVSIDDYCLQEKIHVLDESIKTKREGIIECIAELPDGRIVGGLNIINNIGGIIKIWDLKIGVCEQQQKYDEYAFVRSVVHLLAGQILIALGPCILEFGFNNISHYNVWKFCIVEHIVIVQPEGTIVYTNSSHDGLNICTKMKDIKDMRNNVLPLKIDKHPDLQSISCMVALLDGRIATGHRSQGHNGKIAIWDIKTGKIDIILTGHTDTVKCIIAISNRIIISGSSDSKIKIWDLVEEKCIQTLHGHSHSVACIAKLPDGRLISGSYDSTLRIWCLKEGNWYRDNYQDIDEYDGTSVVIFEDKEPTPITKILVHSNGQIFFVSRDIIRVFS